MRVIDLENINYAMRNETQFVLRCEEVFHDKISAAAAAILSNRQEKPVVALTGPSGSGKTTTAMRLQEYLQNLGVKVCLLSMDNFFLPLDKRPPEATDWESPYCVDVDTLLTCISQLLDGMEADIPWYDFKNGVTGGYKKMQGEKDCIVIAEGIHMLNPLIFDKLRGIANGVYDQLHHAPQGQRRHSYRHLPRLRALHPGQIPQRDSPVPSGADPGVPGKARPDGPDEGSGRGSSAAHPLCSPQLHRPRVRGRQLQ